MRVAKKSERKNQHPAPVSASLTRTQESLEELQEIYSPEYSLWCCTNLSKHSSTIIPFRVKIGRLICANQEIYLQRRMNRIQREKRTIDSQLSTLTAYAQCYDYKVYRIYQDDGFSGSTIEGRPAFRQFLIDCGKGKFEAILVVEHNRITRSENPEEVGKIQRILMENNIRIISPP